MSDLKQDYDNFISETEAANIKMKGNLKWGSFEHEMIGRSYDCKFSDINGVVRLTIESYYENIGTDNRYFDAFHLIGNKKKYRVINYEMFMLQIKKGNFKDVTGNK